MRPTYYFDTTLCKYVPLFVFISNICLIKSDELPKMEQALLNKETKVNKLAHSDRSKQEIEAGNAGDSDQQ